MRFNLVTALALAALFASPIRAQEAASQEGEAEAQGPDPALEAEIAYVEALVSNGYPDFAEPVIEATKKKWPEADARFFAIEVDSLIALGKMEEAEKRIAALPERKGPKYWGARLRLANNYSARNRKDECKEIYEGFFKAYANPTKDVIAFYLEACYQWGQILVNDKKYAEATEVYEKLLKQKLSTAQWCMMACETADLYIRLATEEKDKKKVPAIVANAERLADGVLSHPDQPVYFGRGVAMKAHARLLAGQIQEAQDIIEEFLPQLMELNDNIIAFDPDGLKGLRKMSPLPQCRYLLAEMLWKAAQEEYAKPKRNDDLVKDYLFGAKDESSGKRNGMGAYNHSLNVFLNSPESSWAAKAGELSDAIENFAIEKYQAKIAKKITPEMIARVISEQFRGAQTLVEQGEVDKGIDEYLTLLGQYPETESSLSAIESLCKAYHIRMAQEKSEAKKNELRLDLDAIEGYLTERFAGNKDRAFMTKAGDSALRVAAMEKEFGQIARAAALRRQFGVNYRAHANAANTIAGLAGEAQKDEKWAEAADLWAVLGDNYTNSTYYVSSFLQRSFCAGKLGEKAMERDMMKAYIEHEENPVRKLQSQLALAQMYQKDGFELVKSANQMEDQAEAEKTITQGSAAIIRGIQQFREFVKKIDELLADPNVSAQDKAQYAKSREDAAFLIAECWCRLKKPAAKIEMFRKNAAENLEAYLATYPTGKYATPAYVKLSMAYTALGEMMKSKEALDRLSKAFPDSEEAKNAKPQLAKSLIEMGLKKEGAELYAEMLRTDGSYSAAQFVNAGEALIDAKSWDLANQAFERAIRMAGTNQLVVVARARIGEAKSLFRQNQLVEAREALDLFLANEKMAKMGIAAEANLMLVEVASEQGRTEKDANMRAKDFGAAVGAVRKLRAYWKSKPQHEQDQIDLMAADIIVRRMKSEEAMGFKEAALETCAKAAAILQSFRQAKGVSDDRPADKMSAGELDNLQRCYETMIPLFSKMGAEQADRVILFSKEYLELFPNGKKRTDILNYMNQAQAEGVQTK